MNIFINNDNEIVVENNENIPEIGDIDDILTIQMNNKWNLWYHSLNDNNWSIDSYHLISSIVTIEDLIYIIKNIKNINNGLYFIMKAGISPIYEDKHNINGGYWSFRINKKFIFNKWIDIIYYMVIINFNNDDIYKDINGISLSPKVNNSIIKIWNNNFEKYNKDDINKLILNINDEEIYYLKHEFKN
jgi:hypothetical protein